MAITHGNECRAEEGKTLADIKPEVNLVELCVALSAGRACRP